MKSIRTAAVVVAGLLAALWWGVRPPSYAPQLAGPVKEAAQEQCPPNTELKNKECTCPDGTKWTGAQCMQVWSSAPREGAPGRG